ncbi:MAG: hypothetical protein AAB967_00290 [Patescibacteria group bacterium]
MNQPDPRVFDVETRILAVTVSLAHEVVVERKQVIFKAPLKNLDVGFVLFPDLELVPRIK